MILYYASGNVTPKQYCTSLTIVYYTYMYLPVDDMKVKKFRMN